MAIGSSDNLVSRVAGAVRGNVLYALIAANAIVFAGVAAGALLSGAGVPRALVLPASLVQLFHQPWCVVSYMFVQASVLQLLFNMLWLYCFGRLMLTVATQKRLAFVYARGGLAGAAFFIIWYSMVPGAPGATLAGASAAVLAVAVAVAFELPDMPLQLWLVGSVRMKWVVLVMVALFCFGFTGGAGAAAAHLGGAAFGAAAGWTERMRRRTVAAPRRTLHDELDDLLDKVKTSGYESLSRRDRERLFQLSHKVKK